MPTCVICPGRTFYTHEALHQHKINSKGHFYCKFCAEDFTGRNALLDHAAIAHSTACASCRRIFTSEGGLAKHLFDSPKHPKCRPCRLGFHDRADHAAHKAEVHGNRSSANRSSKRGRNHRPFSPVKSTDNSSTPSSTLRSQSPSSSATAENSDRDDMLQKTLSPSRDDKDGMLQRMMSSSLSFADVPRHVESPRSFTAADLEKGGQMSAHGSPISSDARKNSLREVRNRTPSPCLSDVPVSRPRSTHLDVPAESNENFEPDRSPVEEASAFTGMTISFASPLLEASVPLPSDSGSDVSVDGGDVHLLYASEWARPRSSSPRLQHRNDSNFLTFPSRGRIASPTPTYNASKVTDTMRAAWRARCAAATRSSSPRRLGSPSNINTARAFSQFSRLPTISDESEVEQELELEYDSDALAPLITAAPPEMQQLKRPVGFRKRRLSLSPTLSSIPEAAQGHGFGAFLPDAYDSDSDSSQGIFEHRAEDFLYDSLSENERCQTPMTYLTADEPEFEPKEDESSYANEQRTCACVEKNSDCSCPPALLVEDLTELAREMCSPSTADSNFDQFIDPFNLHPSANNSPMNATFPKRPRAWSVGAPASDAMFLIPAAPQPLPEDVARGKEIGKLEKAATARSDVNVEEIDEAAIAADEPPPTVIEDDLFSEPDEIMEPLPQEDAVIEPEINTAELQFAEEGHPLRSLISLDTLPLSPKARRLSEDTMPSSVTLSLKQCSLRTAAGTESNNLESSLDQKSPLYCRLCQADPCKEVTATFCGHIFCNGCITREVMATSKCPVCSTPTLLYCLFKLDLAS